MRVKLQLVICHDDGCVFHAKAATDSTETLKTKFL